MTAQAHSSQNLKTASDGEERPKEHQKGGFSVPDSNEASLTTVGTSTDPVAYRIWDIVSHSPLENLWSFRGAPVVLVWKRTFSSVLDDNLLSRAAELGFYFLFALFPTLVSASSLLGLAARHASDLYASLLQYFALVVPPTAYGIVIQTFNQTAIASTRGKITLGFVAALWSASVGFSAIQDGMNAVYRVKETRPYWKARGSAILVTFVLSILVTLNLTVLLGGDFGAKYLHARFWHHALGNTTAFLLHAVAFVIAAGLLLLQLSIIYYYAPDVKKKKWRLTSPGAVFALLGWMVASVGFKIYLHFSNTYTVTYGSLGAVIVLLTWFYITGLMILVGAEINSEIEAVVLAKEIEARKGLDTANEVERVTNQLAVPVMSSGGPATP
jgi:membrane protein